MSDISGQGADAGRLSALASLLNGRRFDDALRLSETLLAEGRAHPLPLRIVAAARRQAGRFNEAIDLYQQLTALAPRDPRAWAALADGLAAARRPEDAVAAWDRALALAPQDPSLLCGKAGVLQSLGRLDAAEDLFRQARAVDADRFEALFGLSTIGLDRGDRVGAETMAATLLARYPDRPAALWLGARIAEARGDVDAVLSRTAALIAHPEITPEQKADALLLRSRALDGADRPADAFAAAAEGKAIQHALYAQRAASRESEPAKMKRLAAWFETADTEPWRTAPPEVRTGGAVRGHVFLVGFPRSGTTLLEQVLAGHPDVVALEEAPTMAEPYAEFLTTADGLERLAELDPARARIWRSRYWAEVAARGLAPAGKLFLDKAPAGTIYLPLVAKLFPHAKVLFAVRDPRDVVLSCFRNNFQLNAMTYAFTDLAQTAACYDACMTMAEIYRRVLPLEIREVRHEALVEDFAGEVAAIARFLGLKVTPAMADIAGASANRTIRTPSAVQVREGLNRRGLARWRAYEQPMTPVLPVLGPWVERFGY